MVYSIVSRERVKLYTGALTSLFDEPGQNALCRVIAESAGAVLAFTMGVA